MKRLRAVVTPSLAGNWESRDKTSQAARPETCMQAASIRLPR